MTPSWLHSPENETFGESWTLKNNGAVVAFVIKHSLAQYSGCVYPLGKPRKVGDVYGTAAGAKAACVRQLRKTGVIS